MPQSGGTNDFAETKDVNANVLGYYSQFGEYVAQSGLVLGNPFLFSGNATVPASASLAQTNASLSASAVLTLPDAGTVTAGHVLVIQDAAGGATSSNTIAVKTPTGGKTSKIGGVSNNTASTSAASYAFINSAYGSIRLASDGTNWNPF
jgi:hypothetical protein